ncbi:imelysin family protein [Vibrio methylphosphonaticus]|uniref:imelysin family protein n=1 Tax=Vibrio methylphosphonaticus TaxID=2946866 RepID=UPI002029D134|nr:imelysin family protein [Vibrio methylphosphonaticus]MCL9775854.1 imelysin family protein [Vibrio methylphosphonaticus]
MNHNLSMIGLLPVMFSAMLVGCAATSDEHVHDSFQLESYQPEQTQHVSQSVYEREHQSAVKFNLAMGHLHQQSQAYCQQGESIASVEHAWQQGMAQWMWLQGQERGPTQALEQNWNIQFWPDKKNTTGRKMTAASQRDQWSVAAIKDESVTVQGLGAVEWLLFDPNSNLDTNPSSSCSLLIAVTGALTERSDTIVQAWSANPWRALDDKAWTAEYLALLTNQLDYSMKKLSRPLAKIGAAKPYFSESWRSQTSMLHLRSNVEALQALYLANGQGLDAILRESGSPELAMSIERQFRFILETWPESRSLFELLQSKEGYRMVLSQYNKLEQLRYLMSEEAAIKLGVVIGFNATDGD